MNDSDYIDERFRKWLAPKPYCIKEAALKKPPDRLYRIPSGHIVYIASYIEPGTPESAKENCGLCKVGALDGHKHAIWPAVTVSVVVTAKYNPHIIMERRVFGILLDDLFEVPDTTLSEGKL